jgi:hypothetical protein
MKIWFLALALNLLASPTMARAEDDLPVAHVDDPSGLVLRNAYPFPRLWHLMVSYCYIGKCDAAERTPKYYLGMSFETGEECVAKIELITKGQSRLMAMHRTFACSRTFEDPGPDDPTKERSWYDEPTQE